jgi:hypothetical protein
MSSDSDSNADPDAQLNAQLNAWFGALLADVARYGDLSPERRSELAAGLAEVEVADGVAVDELLEALVPQGDGREQLLALFLERQVQPWLVREPDANLSTAAVERLAAWYAREATASLLRFPILRTLAIDGSAQASALLADAVATMPPADPRQALMALVPLFQPRSERPEGAAALWPRLLEAVSNPQLAPAVLDLANFSFRRGWVSEHPAKGRTAELASIVGSLAGRLAAIEERPAEFASTPIELSRIVNDGVTLLVSLCDALALAGDRSVVGKLRQALGLAHRRVQTEAAAALARLGEEEGVKQLGELAKEPVVRTRVLAYLEELGKLDTLDASLRSAEARAQGDLAAWMAQPTRFGVAPDELELIDRTRQYWPGYVDPVECFLFTYEYRRGNQAASGVGIAGPTTSALQFDLQDLPPSDIYAMYAGLDAEHSEIFETSPDDLSIEQEDAWERVSTALGAQGYEDRELMFWGTFFGEQHAVATAMHDGRSGVIVVGDDHSEWFAFPAVATPFGPREAYALFKGRKLLKTFNHPQGPGGATTES